MKKLAVVLVIAIILSTVLLAIPCSADQPPQPGFIGWLISTYYAKEGIRAEDVFYGKYTLTEQFGLKNFGQLIQYDKEILAPDLCPPYAHEP